MCQPVSLLAAAWDVPVVSFSCASSLLSDKSVYPTFSRVVAPWAALAPMFDNLADQFGWSRVGMRSLLIVSIDDERYVALYEIDIYRKLKKISFFFLLYLMFI